MRVFVLIHDILWIQGKNQDMALIMAISLIIMIGFTISAIRGQTIPCDGVGIQAVADQCNKFVNCDHGNGVIQSCGPGTVFHKVCVKILRR